MSQHEGLKDAHVHATTLGVTFGALRLWTDFRVLIRCSKYVMIHLRLGTHIPPTTLCVRFGARRRSDPMSRSEDLPKAGAPCM